MSIRTPRVSIGLPLYNADKYLAKALDSILAQTYTDFELVISDNHSNDHTQDICMKYARTDHRIKYHRNKKNLGAAPNHNLVFKLANGDYFKWAGYDDILSPDFLIKCVDILDNNPDVVLCMSNTAFIDEHGHYLGKYDYKADATSMHPHKRFQNFVLHNESGDYVYGLMRASAVEKTSLHGSYPSSDLVFLAELTLYGQYHVIPEPLFHRRIHPAQSTKGIFHTERSRVLWFDTAFEGKIVFPKWQYLLGYIKVVTNAPLNIYQCVYCFIILIRWALLLPHVRALGKDVLLAIHNFINRSLSKHKSVIGADNN